MKQPIKKIEFNHRKVGINYNLAALLDMLFLECEFDIVWPEMSDLCYILMPPFKLESPIAYEKS